MASPGAAMLERVRSRDWFYEFQLPDGTRTRSHLPPGVEKIHDTRLALLEQALDASVGRDCSPLTALDLACHQGWFALHLAKRGFRSILGVDARDEHLADARLMAEVLSVPSFRTLKADLEDARPEDIGVHDVTLMLGLLYHLENPVRVLRLARAVTRKVMVIESQVVPHLSGMVDWGSYRFQRPMVGNFGIIDETEETHASEASVHGICLAPSIETLEWLLRRVGFKRVERLLPPPDGYEQLVGHKRAMFAAHVD
ncbi:MAG TPA: class I SAM-dependent methyltransferase [Usitatibacter sp.]|nr:class I SAM-dependent methyltransferase [Usitatibacter sp.]